MKRALILIPLAAAAIGLAACSGQTITPHASKADTSAPQLPPQADVNCADPSLSQADFVANCTHANATDAPAGSTPTQDTNERGNIVKRPGDELTLTDQDGGVFASATVDKITLDQPCSGPYPDKPENGHFLTLSLRVSVDSDAPAYDTFDLFNPNDFSVVGPEGVSETNLATMATYSCLDDSETMPDTYAPGSKYRGEIVLDTSHVHGSLVLRPSGYSNGVEWKY